MDWKKIAAIAGGVVLLGSVAGNIVLHDKLGDAKDKVVSQSETIDLMQDDYDALSEDLSALNGVLLEKDAEIAVLNSEVTALSESTEAVEEASGYTIDELKLGDEVTAVVDDSDLEKLYDGKIEFDGKKYNVHEEILLSATMAFSGGNHDKEFGADPAMNSDDKEILKYRYVFDDELDRSKISEEEPLKLTVLGKELEIISADENSITVKLGAEKSVDMGEEIVEGVVLKSVGEESVLVVAGDDVAAINVGSSKKVGDVEVEVVAVFRDSAFLLVGKDVKETFEDGDAMTLFGEPDDNLDAEYLWSIAADHIGAKYNKRLDDKGEALEAGDSLMLPNDFAKVTFLGAKKADRIGYEFSFDDVDIADEKTSVLRLKSSDSEGFVYDDSEETDELVWDGESLRVYDEDVNDWIAVSEVLLGESELALAEDLSFSDFTLTVNLGDQEFTSLKVNDANVGNRDYDILDSFGVIVNAPEDLDDLDKLEFSVPEEQLELEVNVE